MGPIIAGGGWDYESIDMKIGVCTDHLAKKYNGLLSDLVDIDPRGAYFRQSDLQKAMMVSVLKDEHREVFKAMCAFRKWDDLNVGTVKVSYMIRVMASHLRLKFDQYTSLKNKTDARAHPAPLVAIYEKIKPDSPAPTAKKNILNPFIYYRDSDLDGEDDDEDESTIVIDKCFNYTEMKTYVLLSDGSRAPAVKYSAGEDGMVLAHFEVKYSAEPSLAEDGLSILKPEAADSTLKEPAEKKHTGDGESETSEIFNGTDIMNTLPPKARITNLEPGRKSYTLPKADDGDAAISVLLERKAFYIKPVSEAQLEKTRNDDRFTELLKDRQLNSASGIQVGFYDDPALSFDAVVAMAAPTDEA
ncbi:unnamed protein product [Prorocentrum cordatum]|uniref:Uncharacterized protein n=1 Tax=Prorocentrum cordatum TaxID=2364126 RepID=A0ABN9W7E5_9DINO|nr:unnamed protein product [Polarella glacialis]